MRLIKQNDTSKKLVFLMVDSSDHITGKTGLSPTVTISKNGSAFSSPSGTVSEIGSGWYALSPASADVNTLGPLLIHATATGADPVDIEYQVVAFDPYTEVATAVWSASSRTLSAFAFDVNVNMSQTLPTTPTQGTIGDSLKRAADALDATVSSRLAASAYTPPPSTESIADAVWDEVRSQHTTQGTYGKTDEWTTTPSQAATAVWDAANRTLTAFAFNVNVNMDQQLPQTPSDNTIGKSFTLITANVDAKTSTRLAASEYVPPPTASAIADAVWDELRSEHTTQGTFGHVEEWAGGGSAITPDEIASAVWDALRTEHENVGTFGAVDEWAGAAAMQVIVAPLVASIQRPDGDGGVITGWTHAKLRATWALRNVDLRGHDLRLILYRDTNRDTAIAEYKTTTGELTITYAAPDTTVVLDGSDQKTPSAGRYLYIMRDQSTDTVLISGTCVINRAPDAS